MYDSLEIVKNLILALKLNFTEKMSKIFNQNIAILNASRIAE